MNTIEVQKGRVLLSQPFMLDPHFRRSAVLLCDHHEEGSLGFILNKPLDVNVDQLIEDFPEFESSAYYGGPVSTNTIHYIHNVGDLLDESVRITKGVYWGGDFDKLKFLISSKLITPNNIRFYVGYSGWSSGQLLDEMDYGSWIIANFDSNYLFKNSEENSSLWQTILKNKGDRYSVIAQMPEIESWN